MSTKLFSKLNFFVRITARVIPCLLALFVAQFSVAQEAPTFTPIGNFNANSGAMFVSADGNIVTGLSANQTFRWSTSLTEMISFGRLAGSELPAIATSANSDGSVVVGFSESWNEIPLQSTHKVVLWTPEQGWIDLGTPFESSEHWDWNSAPRISANGSVVLAMSSSSIGNKLWRWTTAEGWSNLGQAPNQSAWISGSQRISDNGSVIIANAFNQAFRWTTSGWVGLGVPTASTSFYATCMSNDGSVVVGFISGSNQQSERFVDLFRWTAGSLVNLGSPPFGTLNEEDLFVSGDGLIIAGSAIDSQSLPHIFRLALDSEFQDLAPLPENHTHAEVAAINQDGSVLVGFSQRTNFQTAIIETTQPFRWAVASGMSSLGQFPDTSTDALPKAMNNDGSVIVGVMGRQVQGLPEQFVDIRAFRWTGALGMTVIGTFQTAIQPEDLSQDGSILVGNAEFGSFIHSNEHIGFGDHAFRWSSAMLQDLGVNTLQGEFDSHAEFVSGDGSTVVGTMKFDGGPSLDFSRAFRVTSSVVKVDLGTLRAAGGEFDSSSYIKSNFPLSSSGYEQESGKCVSSDGSVIVGTSESFVSDIPVRRAFRWTSSGMSNLGTLGVGESSVALAVSSDGLTVVGVSGNFQTHLTRAFRWTSGDGMVSLGTLNGTDSSAAFFTSSNGAVVVGTCTGFNGPNEVRKGFRWKDGAMASLGSLPGGAQDLYWPVAINDDGSVVVGLSDQTDAQGVTTRRAFRWTTVGGMSELPAEITDLHGLSLSGNGAIVVGSRIDGEVGRVACLWSSALGLVDLRTYLDGLGVANVGSLNLNNASISQDSKSIAVTYQVDARDAAGIVRGLEFLTSNDDCANALSIELGSVSFNTAGSTTDGNNPTAQYCGPADGSFFNDVWYSFTPSSTGVCSATTCNQANFDTRIDVLDGCGGTLLACNDDACGSLSSYVEFSGVAGQIYLICLGAYSNTFGAGTLTLNQVVSVPTISGVSPSSGTTLGGTAITITGTNLTGATSVTVGGVAATSVNVVSSTSITAVTPAGTAGVSDIVVTTVGGTATGAFSYINIVAPTGVAASDGLFTNKIAVSWNATANAIGYQLFRGATKIADIASGATVSYNDVDGALTPGTSFTYTVKALFTAGLSAPSASDTGFVGFAIVAPTGVAASDGTLTTGVALAWNQQLGATGYQIFRSGTISPIAVLGSVGSYIDLPPLSGKLYTYSLKGIFTAGMSSLSASDSGWQNLVAPSMVAASDGTLTTGVRVTWSAVTGRTGYTIFRSGTETPIGTVGSSSLLLNDTTAIPGTSYEYFVKTNSSAGRSASSLSNTGYRNLSAPTGVAASDGTSPLHVSVTWVASIGATGYQIFRSGTVGPVGTSTATSFNDVGASPGIAYLYTVRATGAVGVSAASSGNTGFRAVSAPTGVAASDGTSATSVIVTWTAVPGATAYKIFRSGSASAIGTVGAVTTFSNTSAAVGVQYTYTVRAVYGTLGMSAASSGDTGYRNRPAPVNVNATDTDTTKVRITWSAVTGSTGYEVFRSIGGAPATLIASPIALLFDDTAIVRGTTAVYSVRAKFVLTGSSPATTVTTLMSVTNSGTRP
jgi:probable HAF family extracellular repeat protein